MSRTLDQQRFDAWHNRECRDAAAPWCRQPVGRRCVAEDGKTRISPHPERIAPELAYDAGFTAGAASRQPEIDLREATVRDLRSQVTDLTRRLTEAAEDITRAQEAHAVTKRELATARGLLAAAEADLDRYRSDLADALAEIERLKNPTPTAPALTFGVGVDQLGTVETKAGARVAYHRTYWTLPATGLHTGAVSQAKADLAAGRTPVMSFKLPSKGDFAGALTGKYDDVVATNADALAELGGIVVMAVEHEPEKYGDLEGFVATTRRYVPLVKRPTVRFWVGLMGYHQLYGSSEWKLDKILVPGVDGYGFDPYLSYGASSDKWTDQTTSYYAKFGAWAKANNVEWGIWETGINEQAITSGRAEARTWFADQVAGAKTHGAVMWIYFNSETTKDGVHDWRLSSTGADKATQMAAVVKQYARR